MENSFDIEIITPESVFFKGRADSLIVDTSEGKVEIRPEHMPIVIGMAASNDMLLTVEGTAKRIVNEKGFLQVHDNSVTVFCLTAEWDYEVEANRLRKEELARSRRIREKLSYVEYKTNKANLARLFDKLKVKD